MCVCGGGGGGAVPMALISPAALVGRLVPYSPMNGFAEGRLLINVPLQ